MITRKFGSLGIQNHFRFIGISQAQIRILISKFTVITVISDNAQDYNSVSFWIESSEFGNSSKDFIY